MKKSIDGLGALGPMKSENKTLVPHTNYDCRKICEDRYNDNFTEEEWCKKGCDFVDSGELDSGFENMLVFKNIGDNFYCLVANVSDTEKNALKDIGDNFYHLANPIVHLMSDDISNTLRDIGNNFYSLADREGIIHLEVLTSI